MAENIVEVDQLVKQFKTVTALDHVSVSSEKGKIHGIIGRNGSGKTVLFKCICGFMQPTEGTVLVEGRPVEPSAAQNIGIIIEDPGFIPSISAFKNLKLLASIRRVVSDDEIRAVIARVGLDPESKKHVGKFSLGMRHRLGIAQAIMEKPRLLIMDEPFNGLDASGVEDVRQLLSSLVKEGTTMLLASHNAQDLSLLCGRICTMEAGVLTPPQPEDEKQAQEKSASAAQSTADEARNGEEK